MVSGFFIQISREQVLVNKIVSDFEQFDIEAAGKIKQLMLMMPDGYDLEYLVYAASGSLSEEQLVMDLEFHKVFRRMMFKKFDSYIEENLSGK